MVEERTARPFGLVAETRARWLSELVVDDRLPERVVLVRNEAAAHSWRRDIIDARPELLMGTRFISPIAAATSVLELAGTSFTTGEEAVRAARIVALLSKEPALEAFDPAVLREGRGWGTALASTIGELEAAGMDLEKLRLSPDARTRDLATMLRDLNVAAGTSWTSARLLAEATDHLRRDPSLWQFSGPCLIEVTGREDVALANWLRAIPRGVLVGLATEPRRERYAERAQNRLGNVPWQAIESVAAGELGILATYLFSSPDVLSDPDRPRSLGNDGTVQFEEHAGLEEELEAAVNWVIAEVGDCGTPLEQLGIVVPRIDPYAALLSARLDVLIPDGVCVLGGVPAIGTSAGARIATLLRALAGYLHIDVLGELLPILELSDEEVHLSRSDAIDALYELGTVGGSAANPSAALEWRERNPLRQSVVAAAIVEARKDEDNEREVKAMVRRLEHLRAITAPLVAVTDVASLLVANAPLRELWSALKPVLADHLRIGFEGARIVATLESSLAPLMEASLLNGEAALDAVFNSLGAIRLPVGRFGEAKVTIGALTDMVDLTFRSVRVIGLAEGTIPASVREDPVLPDSARREFAGQLSYAADRATAQLHALHRIVIGTTERVVLSVARMDPHRRYREPSGALLEAAAAIARPSLGGGGTSIPDTRMLRQHAFEPAREEQRSIRGRWPVHPTGRLDRAVRRRQVPRSWRKDRLLSLDRLLAPLPLEPGNMDGWFPDGAFPELPGIEATKPISASALSRLLECPHRYLYERVLGWMPPPTLADEGNIDALSYGSLFHETAEVFYRLHGTAFCEKTTTLEAWASVSDQIAITKFAEFIETYPLAGQALRNAARRRLQRDLRALLAADWTTAKTFIDVERAFGPVPLRVDNGTIYVHGFIDRLDTVGSTTLVRDLKTGRAKRRKSLEDIRPSYDIQLGLYGLVVQAQVTEWKVPAAVEGAYVYPSDPSGDDRSFAEDFGELLTHTTSWMGTGLELLKAKKFPRTPSADDCTFCSFKPVCGVAANDRAALHLATPSDGVERFAALKLGDESDE